MSNKIIQLNDNNFDMDVLQAKGLFLVDFWAEWCAPCKVLSSILLELANEYDDKIIIAKLNIDKNPLTPSKYDVSSIPTLLLFRNSEVIDRNVGVLTKNQLKNFINKNL